MMIGVRRMTLKHQAPARIFGIAKRNDGSSAAALSTFSVTKIEPRTLLRVSGADATKFLQGLVTNDVGKCSERGYAQHLCFLTTKGRVKHDAILVCEKKSTELASSFIVECAASQAASLSKHLRRYKLRSNVVLEDVSETYAVHVAMPNQSQFEDVEFLRVKAVLLSAQDGDQTLGFKSPPIAYVDPREAQLGLRLLIPSANLELVTSMVTPKLEEEGFAVNVGNMKNEYEALCLIHGILSGDAIGGRIPLECNMEWTNAIAFDKGCYLGQELVARTHFKGRVRKRLIPFYTVSSDEATGTPPLPLASLINLQLGPLLEAYEFLSALTSSSTTASAAQSEGDDIVNLETGKVVGKIEAASGHFNVGIAQIRLEHIFDAECDGNNWENPILVVKAHPHIRIVPFTPHWWAKHV